MCPSAPCVHRFRAGGYRPRPTLFAADVYCTLLPCDETICDNILWQHNQTLPWRGGGLFADFVKNGSAELGFMRPRNECTELFAEHTYSPEHTYSECLSSCSSPVQPIHPEQGLPPSTRIDGWHKDSHCPACKLPSLQVGSTWFSLNQLGSLCKLCSFVWKHTIAPVGSYQLIFAWSD